MKLSIAIVGLPNVGKSTLFKLLTKNDILIANYPFATIDPNVGVVAVPDERLDKLAEMSKSKKKIPAIVEFLRCFPSDEIIHVENSVDPMRDMDIINAELALKDLDTIEKNIKKAEGEAKSGNKEAQKDFEAFKLAKTALEKGELLFSKQHANILENVGVRKLNLLTAKPQIYLLN